MARQPDLLGMISADRSEAEVQRARNRLLMAEHMPDCLRLIDDLKAAGMLGRVVAFEIYEQRKAA